MVLIYEVQIFWDGHKIDEISIFILMLLFLSNVKMKFSSKFVAFSEYQNMNKSILKTIFKIYNILSDCHTSDDINYLLNTFKFDKKFKTKQMKLEF